jgi:hypothetical protein
VDVYSKSTNSQDNSGLLQQFFSPSLAQAKFSAVCNSSDAEDGFSANFRGCHAAAPKDIMRELRIQRMPGKEKRIARTLCDKGVYQITRLPERPMNSLSDVAILMPLYENKAEDQYTSEHGLVQVASCCQRCLQMSGIETIIPRQDVSGQVRDIPRQPSRVQQSTKNPAETKPVEVDNTILVLSGFQSLLQ